MMPMEDLMTNMRGVVGHSEMVTIKLQKLQSCGERRESGVRSGNMIQQQQALFSKVIAIV